MSKVSEETISQAREAFALFDKDSTGSIKTKDLGLLLTSVGFGLPPAALKQLERDADPFSAGTIKQAEFLRILDSAARMAEAWKSDTRKALTEMAIGLARLFEKKNNSDGSTVSAKEFRLALTRMGQKLSDEEFTEMCRGIEIDSNGRIKIESLSNHILA